MYIFMCIMIFVVSIQYACKDIEHWRVQNGTGVGSGLLIPDSLDWLKGKFLQETMIFLDFSHEKSGVPVIFPEAKAMTDLMRITWNFNPSWKYFATNQWTQMALSKSRGCPRIHWLIILSSMFHQNVFHHNAPEHIWTKPADILDDRNICPHILSIYIYSIIYNIICISTGKNCWAFCRFSLRIFLAKALSLGMGAGPWATCSIQWLIMVFRIMATFLTYGNLGYTMTHRIHVWYIC